MVRSEDALLNRRPERDFCLRGPQLFSAHWAGNCLLLKPQVAWTFLHPNLIRICKHCTETWTLYEMLNRSRRSTGATDFFRGSQCFPRELVPVEIMLSSASTIPGSAENLKWTVVTGSYGLAICRLWALQTSTFRSITNPFHKFLGRIVVNPPVNSCFSLRSQSCTTTASDRRSVRTCSRCSSSKSPPMGSF
jgi:hypothetical protein